MRASTTSPRLRVNATRCCEVVGVTTGEREREGDRELVDCIVGETAGRELSDH
jgi:hypothetical protein